MKSKKSTWRAGFGLGQIMATLLIVMPTMAFSIMFLVSYWNIMQIDYKLKLMSNIAADYASASENPQADFAALNGTDINASLSSFCPKGTTIKPSDIRDASAADKISITVKYSTPTTDTYFADTNISTNIQIFSYTDQNMSVVLTCK